MRRGGGAQFLIEGRQRQVASLGELQIASVVNRQTESIRQAERRGPDVDIGFPVDGDWKQREVGQRRVAIASVDVLAPDARLKCVRDFNSPQGRRDGSVSRRGVEQFLRGLRRLVLEIPRHRHGCVDDEAHLRPSAIRSLILIPPKVTPRRRA